MPDAPWRTRRDRQGRRRLRRSSEPTPDGGGLALAEIGQGRIGTALEATLHDPGGLAVTDQDQGRVPSPQVDEPQVQDGLLGTDAVGGRLGDRVVEGQDHERVGIAPRCGRGTWR